MSSPETTCVPCFSHSAFGAASDIWGCATSFKMQPKFLLILRLVVLCVICLIAGILGALAWSILREVDVRRVRA